MSKKYNQIEYLKQNPLDKNDMARMFNVVQRGQNSYFNISRTLSFKNVDNIPPKYYNNYMVTQKDSWTNISFKFYRTHKLWWIICKFNNVSDPFNFLEPGKVIKIPKEELVNSIIQQLGTY